MTSNETHHLLTFELDKKTDELEIHTNREGLKILIQKLESLLATKNNDHTHLMSEEWGGEEITTQKQSMENEIIKSVKIFKWD